MLESCSEACKNRCGTSEGCTNEGRIVRIRGLFAVLCLLASTPGAFAQIATAQTGQVSAYSVDGLALGERVQPNNAGYREYKCGPSHQFDGFTWCQKARQQKEPRRSFKVTYSLLHTHDGTVVYVNRYEAPAFFGPNEAEEDMQRYSQQAGRVGTNNKNPASTGNFQTAYLPHGATSN